MPSRIVAIVWLLVALPAAANPPGVYLHVDQFEGRPGEQYYADVRIVNVTRNIEAEAAETGRFLAEGLYLHAAEAALQRRGSHGDDAVYREWVRRRDEALASYRGNTATLRRNRPAGFVEAQSPWFPSGSTPVLVLPLEPLRLSATLSEHLHVDVVLYRRRRGWFPERVGSAVLHTFAVGSQSSVRLFVAEEAKGIKLRGRLVILESCGRALGGASGSTP